MSRKLTQKEFQQRNKEVGWVSYAIYIGSHNKHLYICPICGSTYYIIPNSIWHQHVMGCVKCMHIKGIKNPLYKGTKDISGNFWRGFLTNAKKRNIQVEIDIHFAQQILEDQQYKCALTGKHLYPSLIAAQNTASIDRIDSSKHYTKDNVWWVHKLINKMKFTYTPERFIKLCQNVHQKTIG